MLINIHSKFCSFYQLIYITSKFTKLYIRLDVKPRIQILKDSIPPTAKMDNPSYFQSLQSPKSPQSPISHQSVVQGPPDLLYEDLYAAFKVDDSEARKHLDENLNILGTRLVSASESPSVKLMKKCSLRRLLSSAAGHKDREGMTNIFYY